MAQIQLTPKVSANIYFDYDLDGGGQKWYYCIFFPASTVGDFPDDDVELDEQGPFETRDEAIAEAIAEDIPSQLAESARTDAFATKSLRRFVPSIFTSD